MIKLVNPLLKEVVRLALIEDIGTWDLSSAIIPDSVFGECSLVAKDSGVLAGSDIFCEVFRQVSPEIEVLFLKKDGDALSRGEVVAKVKGRLSEILIAERTALNFLQHLSGIATKTRRIVKKIKESGSRVKLLDTRKTTPLLRTLEKYAVFCGGGKNHRHSLNSGVIIKDNHIDALGSVEEAVRVAKNISPTTVKIEVECRNLEEVRKAVLAGCDIVMLDNMGVEEIKKAVSLIEGKVKIEVSGNITENNISDYLHLNIDYISMGSITHSVKAFDFSLKVAKILK